MRLTLHPRLSRVVRALPQGGPLAWLEVLLLVVLAVQLARVVWTVATPVGPLGRWRPEQPAQMTAAARAALFARFDPFFRTGTGAGPAAVTSLSLKLFGIRMNEASGQGSAIIAGPDGIQSSVGVGDEIVAGVKLKAVAIDHVVIDRGGTDETLYLDQSQAAPVATPGGAPGTAPAAAPSTGAAPLPAQPPAAYNAPPDLTAGAAGMSPQQMKARMSAPPPAPNPSAPNPSAPNPSATVPPRK